MSVQEAGLIVSIVGLVLATWRQATSARRVAEIAAISATERARTQVAESLRLIEEVRHKQPDRLPFEGQYLLLTIETYLANAEVLGTRDELREDRLLVAALGQIVPVFCTDGDRSKPAGELFRQAGFPEAGRLADKAGMKCP